MGGLPRAARIAIALVIALAVVYVLFTIVFPWVESNWQDPTLGGVVDAASWLLRTAGRG